MVNLRFHIVSITAVFLALAIGIVVGSTLLDRATVDSLTARQASLEDKIDERVAENNAFRDEISMLDGRDEEFEAGPMAELTRDTVSGDVLVVGVRGIDEGQVAALQSDLAAAGAALHGVVWLDESLDTDDEGRRRALADALAQPEVADDPDAARDALVERLSQALGAVASAGSGVDGDAPPAPATTGEPPAAGSSGEDALPVDPVEGLAALDGAALVVWEPAPGADEVSAPPAGTRLLFVSGEGAQLAPDQLALPLLGALDDLVPEPLVAVEVMDPRSRIGTIERAQAGNEPVRGAFVDGIRSDEELAGEVVTVDNGDRPFGRMALILVLGASDPGRVGHYGEADTAERAFPPVG